MRGVAQRSCRPQLTKDFTTEATEVTEKRHRKKLWVNKRRSLPAQAEVPFSVVSVRSVVNFFFAAGEEGGP